MTYLYIILLAALVAREAQWHFERKEWAKERATLLQRIQAPQIAVMEHQSQTTGPLPLHVPFDDDEAFRQSKEDLADRLMVEELDGAR